MKLISCAVIGMPKIMPEMETQLDNLMMIHFLKIISSGIIFTIKSRQSKHESTTLESAVLSFKC